MILFLNYLLATLKEMPAHSPGELLGDLGTVGIFQYLAWYVIFRLLLASDRARRARALDLVVITAFCLPVFAPTGKTIWIAATGIALYIWIFNADDIKLRAAGIVLAALSVQELWGHILFNLITQPLLRAETAAVGTVMDLIRPGTLWHDNVVSGPSGFSIIIINSCSSFHNLSLALLCWVTISRMWHQTWRRRDFAFGATIAAIMILFNVTRICLMSWNRDFYHYWHGGFGAQIFAVGASLTVLLLSLVAARPGERAMA